MINKDLLDYVRSEKERGIPKDTIKKMLLESGWQEKDIVDAEQIVYAINIAPAPVRPIEKIQPVNIQPTNILGAIKTYGQTTSQPSLNQSGLNQTKLDLPDITEPTNIVPQKITGVQPIPILQVQPHKSYAKIGLTIIVVMLVLLLGVAAYAYYSGYFAPF